MSDVLPQAEADVLAAGQVGAQDGDLISRG